jgi:DNA polymerase III alpha subunit
MRPAWRRVAERGDKHAYAVDEISRAMVPALEQDCRADLRPDFVRDIRAVFKEREARLFKEDVAPRIEALRSSAGCGIGLALVNNVSFVSQEEADGIDALVKATEAALRDCAARRARQVEEHYLRKSSSARAYDVRGRLEQAIATTDLHGLAMRVLNIDVRRLPVMSLKQGGLDDGVKLR